MQSIDLVQLYTARLNQAGIKYMITGSIACIIYGEPRLTHDVDLVVEMNVEQITALRDAFPTNEFYCPPDETLRIDILRRQRGNFNIIHHATGFKADFYLVGLDPIQKWGFNHAKEVDTGGTRITLAPPEYVILRKLEYYREGGSEKHLRDIRGVLRKLPQLKDSKDLSNYLQTLGLISLWQQVISEP